MEEMSHFQSITLAIMKFIQWFCQPRIRRARSTSEVSTSEGVRESNYVLDEGSNSEGVIKMNNMLHQIYTDGNDDSEVIVIFFHGLIRCRDVDTGGNIHVSTWISEDEDTNSEVLWPRVWLVDEFPKSRIYTVKYDASIKETDTAGRARLYNLVENMVTDIILAFPPEFWSRPVVLVGHSFGGIVIKQLLVFAQRRQAEYQVYEGNKKMTINNFLDNVKLIFYFSTPHLGMAVTIENKSWPTNKMVEEYTQFKNPKLSTLDSDFAVIAQEKDWLEAGVGEQNCTKWDSIKVNALVVLETSSRSQRTHGRYISLPENHFSISRPRSRRADSFDHLVKHIKSVLPLQSENVEIQKPTRLNPSQILRVGGSRRSRNGVYRLVMQKDNNLVLHRRGRGVIWSSQTTLNLPNCYCVMQTDGNAVIYAVQERGRRQKAIWSTNTWCEKADASRYIEVQDDGNLVMYDEWRQPVWATNTWDTELLAGARLTSNQVLDRGAFLVSPNEDYKLIMQDDCNLVLYHIAGTQLLPIWASNTYTSEKVKHCYFIMQADGSAVLYAGDTDPLNALWSTKTNSQTDGSYYLEVDDNGNVVMYDEKERKAVWATHTSRGIVSTDKITSGQVMYGGDSRVSLSRRYTLLMQCDGVLVLYKKDEGSIWASGKARQTYQEAVLTPGGTPNCYLIMTRSGTAEIHVGNKVLWSTPERHGSSNGTVYMEVRNDGNVVMYDMVDRGCPRQQLWATNTAAPM